MEGLTQTPSGGWFVEPFVLMEQDGDSTRRTGREKVKTRPSQVPEKRCIFRRPGRARYRSRAVSEGRANAAIEIGCGKAGRARDEHRRIVEVAAGPYAR